MLGYQRHISNMRADRLCSSDDRGVDTGEATTLPVRIAGHTRESLAKTCVCVCVCVCVCADKQHQGALVLSMSM